MYIIQKDHTQIILKYKKGIKKNHFEFEPALQEGMLFKDLRFLIGGYLAR